IGINADYLAHDLVSFGGMMAGRLRLRHLFLGAERHRNRTEDEKGRQAQDHHVLAHSFVPPSSAFLAAPHTDTASRVPGARLRQRRSSKLNKFNGLQGIRESATIPSPDWNPCRCGA